MNTDRRTLRLVVDSRRATDGVLAAVDLTEVVERAAREAAERAAKTTDPTVLYDQLNAALGDEQLAERLGEPPSESEPEAAATLLTEVLVDDGSGGEGALTDDESTRVAEAFLAELQRELVAIDDEAMGLVELGAAARRRGAVETARDALELAREIAREADDSRAAAAALAGLGDVALRDGSADDAEEQYQASLDRARESGDESAEATALAGLGNVDLQREALDAAEEYHRESLAISRRIDDQSTEANSLASLGTIADRRGDADTAETYLRESLDLKRLVGDEAGEATALASLGSLEEGRGAYAEAVDHYVAAAEGFASTGQTEARLEALQGVVDCQQADGRTADAVETCEDALSVLDDVGMADADSYRRWFRTRHAGLTGDAEAVASLYEQALGLIADGDDPGAFELLDGLWECRSAFDPETTAYSHCLRAGVAFAAYHLLLEEPAVDTGPEEIVETIDAYREALSEPAAVLLAFVRSGGADRELDIDPESPAAEGSVDAIERRVFADFLDRISETPPPAELYAEALARIADSDGDLQTVVQLCLVTWENGEPDSRPVLGAGLVAEVHRERFDIRLPFDRETVVDRIEANRTELSAPLAVLFERFTTGSTDVTPEELVETADTDDPTIVDVERVVVARLLGWLDD
ncbi:tetratricopeptide repeat protein [Halohasta salina]|uniref:tetratricopeptide repeat protein n=1 Tax=Halohasta salina TaxID=2961621 RepID=UPI0020A584BD|nr:tetratricopeptide repeat protein [Halohasta salina]